jgi:uncharacterized membrane protein
MFEEIKTILIAMSPLLELRGAIPVALFQYHLNPFSAFFFSVLGNMIPCFFLLLYLEKFSNYFSSKSPLFKKVINWFFERTRRKHGEKFNKSKELALMLFVAIPLPVTGAWTGSVCAFLFDIPFSRALPMIFLGVVIAGIIVTLFSLGIINFNNFVL